PASAFLTYAPGGTAETVPLYSPSRTLSTLNEPSAAIGDELGGLADVKGSPFHIGRSETRIPVAPCKLEEAAPSIVTWPGIEVPVVSVSTTPLTSDLVMRMGSSARGCAASAACRAAKSAGLPAG